ncbi:MAG: hypothetical protein ACKPKO_07090, partial [Candidatus Fonsibacter sp.]
MREGCFGGWYNVFDTTCYNVLSMEGDVAIEYCYCGVLLSVIMIKMVRGELSDPCERDDMQDRAEGKDGRIPLGRGKAPTGTGGRQTPRGGKPK